MSHRLHVSAAGGLLALLIFCTAHAEPVTREKPQELREYHMELRRLMADPPADEYIGATIDGTFVFRKYHLWVKADPAVKEAEGISRRFTIYLDDSTGNRLRTLPNWIALSVAPPARLKAGGEQRLKNGQGGGEVLYGPGQESARLTLTVLPFGAGPGAVLELPAANQRSVRYLALVPEVGSGPRVRTPVEDARGVARTLLQDARQFMQLGRRSAAQRMVFSRGGLLLEAGLSGEALKAFRLGAKDFGSLLCAWGEVQLLQKEGLKSAAGSLAEELRLRHPACVPAVFMHGQPGELWHVPLGEYFSELPLPRAR